MKESVVFTVPYQAIWNRAKVSSTVGDVIWKNAFDFTEIVNNYELKWETVCEIVRFISQFSLKLYIQFWRYLHSITLTRTGRGYSKKK